MAKESTVARESRVNPLNAVSSSGNRLSKRKVLDGWRGVNQPKSKSVKVLNWLLENDLYVSGMDASALWGTTFNDIIKGRNYDSVETLLRDAIYDGANSLKRKR